MNIPFNPDVSYVCVNGVATAVPNTNLPAQLVSHHAQSYYNGPANVDQATMNAWCTVGHPITSAATPKTDLVLARAGIQSSIGLSMIIAAVIVIALLLLRFLVFVLLKSMLAILLNNLSVPDPDAPPLMPTRNRDKKTGRFTK